MQAVTIDNGEIKIAEVADPNCGSEDLLVRVASAGLNAADILQKKGLYPAPKGIPQNIPGLEFAGQVVKCGDKTTGFVPGDMVMGVVGGGAQAELTTIHYSNAIKIPQNVDIIHAGGFCETYLTAFDALVRQANLKMGEKVLVNGAAGGVGLSAITIASLLNSQVFASARHKEHHNYIQQLGATPVVPEETHKYAPFNVILELVGGINMEDNLSSINEDGRITVIGVGAGAKCEVDLRILMAKRIKLFGSTLRARSTQSKAILTAEVQSQLIPLLSAEKLPVTVASTYHFNDAAQAYKAFATPGKLGKVILRF